MIDQGLDTNTLYYACRPYSGQLENLGAEGGTSGQDNFFLCFYGTTLLSLARNKLTDVKKTASETDSKTKNLDACGDFSLKGDFAHDMTCEQVVVRSRRDSTIIMSRLSERSRLILRI